MEERRRKGARYQPVLTSLWRDEKITPLDDQQKLLWVYLLTSPHSNMVGLYYLPMAYAITDLGWTPQKYTKQFGLLQSKGFFDYDHTARVIFIKNQLKHRPLENQNQVKSAADAIKELPKTKLFQSLLTVVERLGKPLYQPLAERLCELLRQPMPQPVSLSPTESPTVAGGEGGNAPPAPPLPAPAMCFKGQKITITEQQHAAYQKAFGGVGLEKEYAKMDAWLISHPKRTKKDLGRFAMNWLRSAAENLPEPEPAKEQTNRPDENTCQTNVFCNSKRQPWCALEGSCAFGATGLCRKWDYVGTAEEKEQEQG